MLIDKDFIEAFKKSLYSISSEKISEWKKDLELQITSIFLYQKYYRLDVKQTQGDKDDKPIVKYTIIDTGNYFPSNTYRTVGDFLNNLTGSTEWSEEFGLRTYALQLQDYWSMKLINEIEKNLEKNGVDIDNFDAVEMFSNTELEEELKKYIYNFWSVFISADFNKLIEKNLKEVHNNTIQDSIKKDILKIKEDQNKREYLKIEKDILNLFMFPKAKRLTPRNKTELELLQHWAKNRTFKEIKLFNKYYPLFKSLKNFRWLDKNIYNEKFREEREVKSQVASFLSQYGVLDKTYKPPFFIKQLYALYSEILEIKGDKYVYITIEENNDCIRFFIDKYGRVGNQIDDFLLFLNVLEKSLIKGSVLIREVSDKTYEIKRGRKTLNASYYNIYGAFMERNHFRGLSSNEIKEVYTHNSELNDFLPKEEGDCFKNWIIGNTEDF